MEVHFCFISICISNLELNILLMKFTAIVLLLLLITTSCAVQKTSSVETNRDGSLTLFNNSEETNTVYVTRDGNMGIGKKNPSDKLEVNGQIHARSVKVDLKEWADTVFEIEYDLMRLREIESYIATHGHLPEIPSAAVVLKDGIELGEMNMLLLKKVEELTLHLIKKEKQIDAIIKDVERLQQEVSSLKKE